MRKVRDFNWVLQNGHFDKLAHETGSNIFLVDTGVFIDLENTYHNNSKDREHPSFILKKIEYPLIITTGVLEELRKHREMKINRRYEISAPTSILVYELFEKSIDILRGSEIGDLELNELDRDRYNVFSAISEAFKDDSRKGEKDIASRTDIELLSMAMHLSRGFYNGEPLIVNVLSPDQHISRTINFLNKGDYDLGRRMIRAIPTRNDLRSYLR